MRPLRLLLDENLSAATARALRADGHDVIGVAEFTSGTPDDRVVALAREAGRVLVTFDSDIGERIFRLGDPPPPGVVYLRFIQPTPAEAAALLRPLLRDGTLLLGWFVTVGHDRTRARPLPPRQP